MGERGREEGRKGGREEAGRKSRDGLQQSWRSSNCHCHATPPDSAQSRDMDMAG